jgi:hypothetical protein
MENEFQISHARVTKKAQWCLDKRRQNVEAEFEPLTPQSRAHVLIEVQGCLRRIERVIAELLAKFEQVIQRLRQSPDEPHYYLACHICSLPALCVQACERLDNLACLTPPHHDTKNEVLAIIKHVAVGLAPVN